MAADANQSIDNAGKTIVIAGKRIGGRAKGEFVNLAPEDDRAAVLKGLDANTFVVNPQESVVYVLTITLLESSKSIRHMDTVYQAGVPVDSTYIDGETNVTGSGMVLRDATISGSDTGTTRQYAVVIINATGPRGAAKVVGG